MHRLFLAQVNEKFRNTSNISKKLLALGPWNNQIKLIREALGMTQTQAAKRLKSTQIQISNIENRNTNPTVNTLKRIAKALNCTLQINFVPNEDILKTVKKLAEKKVNKLINISVSNAALEDQKPSKKTIRDQKQYLKNKLITKQRSSLWED